MLPSRKNKEHFKMSMTNDEDGATPKIADATREEPRVNDK